MLTKLRKNLAVILIGTSVIFPFSAIAQNVVLNAKIGNVRVQGKLVEYDGEFYRVQTDLGVLTIDGRTVTCTGEACPAVSDMVSRFTITGSGDLGQNLVPTLIEAFAQSLGAEATAGNITPAGQTISVADANGQQIAEVTVSVQPADVQFATLAGKGDVFAATSRVPNDAEITQIKAAGRGDPVSPKHQQVLAVDGVVAVVSPVNPVDTISLPNLARILRGTITNWRQVGGPDMDISLYLPAENDSFALAVQNSPLGVTLAEVVGAASKTGTLAEISDMAAGDPYGIALTSFSNIRNGRALGLRGTCGIYTMPSLFTLKSGGYPLTFKHYFFRPKTRLPIFAREFLEFARSEQAQNVIRTLGYGDLEISSLSVEHQGLRLINSFAQAGKEVPLPVIRKLMLLQNGAKRLSTTFRFKPGSKTLDGQSRQNAELLASGLILGNYADKQVHLVGFSDAAGGSKQNIKLANQRAQTVLAALKKAAPDSSLDDVVFKVSGFGEASPLACEDTLYGKQVNRRVEVWIKDAP